MIIMYLPLDAICHRLPCVSYVEIVQQRLCISVRPLSFRTPLQSSIGLRSVKMLIYYVKNKNEKQYKKYLNHEGPPVLQRAPLDASYQMRNNIHEEPMML